MAHAVNSLDTFMVLYKEDWLPDKHEAETAAFSVRAVEMAKEIAATVLNDSAIKNVELFPGVVWARIGVVTTNPVLRIAVVEIQKSLDSDHSLIGLINCYRYNKVEKGGLTLQSVCKSLSVEKIIYEHE